MNWVAKATVVLTALPLLAGIEEVGRSFPRLMPPEWQIGYHFIHSPDRTARDDDVGFVGMLNQHELIRSNDYSYMSETDRKGFPNHEPWPERPTIVVLGDSLVLGVGVGVAENFPTLAVQQLPGDSLVNLGVAGAGPERQSAIYRKFGVGLRPRFVAACLYLESDFENDEHFHAWRLLETPTDYNAFRLDTARRTHERSWLQKQLYKSWLYGLARETFLGWFGGHDYFPQRGHLADGTEVLFGEGALRFASAAASTNDRRVDALMRSVNELRTIVERNGAALLIVLVPSKEELFGVPAAVARDNVVARTRERLQAAHVSVLDLYPTLQGSVEHATYFREDMHLTAYGNGVAAGALAAWIRSHDRDARR